MGNAADELHALYSSWRAKVEEASNVANALQVGESHGIAEIRRAFGLLGTISGQLQILGAAGFKVRVFQRQLDGWSRVPLSLPAGWAQGAAPDHVATLDQLDQIEALAGFLDGRVIDFDDARLQGLRPLIDHADSLLTDDDMDPALRSYIRRLISEIRLALDDEAVGHTFDFTSAVERLRVAFQAAAEAAPTGKKSAWRDLATQIIVGLVSTGAVEGGRALLSIAMGS